MKNNTSTVLGFPPLSINLLAGGFLWVMICLGIRIARGSGLAVKIADTQLIIASSAENLAVIAKELSTQVDVIEQKDEAYRDLSQIYDRSLREAAGYEQLKAKIETIQKLPEVENLENIRAKIEVTESDLSEVDYK